jgi:predicted deacylase
VDPVPDPLLLRKSGIAEHGNEISGSIICWEILEWLSELQLFKMDSATWS